MIAWLFLILGFIFGPLRYTIMVVGYYTLPKAVQRNIYINWGQVIFIWISTIIMLIAIWVLV